MEKISTEEGDVKSANDGVQSLSDLADKFDPAKAQELRRAALNTLPREPAIESPESHPLRTDLSLTAAEKPPMVVEQDAEVQSPEQSEESKLNTLKGRVKDIMISTYESRVNNQLASSNPGLLEKITEIKDSLTYDPEDGKPSDDEIRAILSAALPLLEQYKNEYDAVKQEMMDSFKQNRIQKSEEKKIYNLLHAEENDRLRKRRSPYTAYDLSQSKAIPDEYVGLSFEEVKQIEEEKRIAKRQGEQGIFSKEEIESEPRSATESQKEKMESFYAELSLSEDEPKLMEAVEFYDNMDWRSFPNTISIKTAEEESESAKETRQYVGQLQSFAEYAEDNPRGESSVPDDKLELGNEYNHLITSIRKINNRLNGMGRELSEAQIRGFCHNLASIVQRYKVKQEYWKREGERSLSDAFDAYADIYGVEAAKNDLGEEIPDIIDKYTVLPLIAKINDAVRQDWKHRITPIESYKEGSKYSFICSRVVEPFPARERRRGIFSCSLLTDSHHETISNSGTFGFVLSPDHIIAAAPHDLETFNQSDDDVASASFGVPVVMSYDRVLRESQGNKTHSEITTRDLPIGIFYFKDKLDINATRKRLKELIRMNPGLPIVAL